MRPAWIVGIIIGIILIYLGTFGLQGFGLNQLSLTGSAWKEDFDTLSLWDTYPPAYGSQRATLSPLGQVYFEAGSNDAHCELARSGTSEKTGTTNCALTLVAAGLPWTVETRIKIDDWGTDPLGGWFEFIVHTSEWYCVLRLTSTAILARDNSYMNNGKPWPMSTVPVSNTPIDLNWHVYTLVFNVRVGGNAPHVELYMDNTVDIGTVWAQLDTSHTPYNDFEAWNLVKAHVDYMYADLGVHAPISYSNVTVQITGQGSTVPSSGNYPSTYLVGSDLYVTANPSSGWYYEKMRRNGVDWTSANPGLFSTLASVETIEVVFALTPTPTPTPTPSPTPSKVTVTLLTRYTFDGVNWQIAPQVPVSVYKGGGYFGTWVTDAAGSYGPVDMDPGSYQWTGTYNGVFASVSDNLVGGTKTEQLGFTLPFPSPSPSPTPTPSPNPTPTPTPSPSPSPNPPPPDIFGFLRNLLSNSTFKQLLQLLGILVTLISTVVFVWPANRSPQH